MDNRGISVTFSYVELGTPGKAAVHQALDLNIIPMGNSIYGYGFETTDRGFLLAYRVFGKSKSDSTGIYIVGKFNGSNATLDSTATLWLPQYPTKGASWLLREGRKMEVVSTDTAVWTSIVFANDSDSTAVIRNGLQRQPAVLFQETAGDTLTHYYFRPGVGCVAFRRAIGGHLAASGILKSFSYGL
ncbi:MAG TPA: hypothetical protein VJ385_06705 [Fibrobacteria bacterium]|nr:hypothetical protein [Fibrobacteria bacterium]